MIMALSITHKALFALIKQVLLFQKLRSTRLSDQELEYIQEHYNPLQRSDCTCNGVDVYMQVKDYIASLECMLQKCGGYLVFCCGYL